MKLVIDIGNSRIKWATTKRRKLNNVCAREFAAEELDSQLPDFFGAMAVPSRIVIGNVAGSAVAEALTGWFQAQWSLAPEFVAVGNKAKGVCNAYAEPATLGVDRWAALIAVHAAEETAALIVDAGTALTVDALGKDGQHMGGLILPGLDMMRRSLLASAPGISNDEKGKTSVLACDTGSAVTAGTLYGLVAAVDRIAVDVAGALDGDVKQVITGGNAVTLLPLLSGDWEHRPELVLDGLTILTP